MLIKHDHIEVWNNCLNTLRKTVSSQAFKTWFEPIKAVELKQQTLTILVPNNFFYDWLEEHFVEQLKQAVTKELGNRGSLRYQIQVENHKKLGITQANASAKEPQIVNPFAIPGLKKLKIENHLNDDYTFEALVTGDCNKLTVGAGLAIAKKPGGTEFNPLVIFGDTGVGKTHISQAIGHQVLKHFPEKQILYISSEIFTHQVVQAIKNNTTTDFINFYNFVEVLIIDDIQFLSGKPKTQELFFNIFNQLHQSGKQIILTSDRPPKDLQDLDERLISRFKWGLVAELTSPDFETRMKILDMKMERDGLNLSHEVKEYICSNIKNNIRELEGVIISLVAQSTLNRKKIDLALVKDVVKQFVSHDDTELSLDKIKKLVAKHFDVPVEKLQEKTRLRNVVVARQLSMYLAKNFTNSSLKVIGDSFGGRDHSTVIHSLRAVQDLMDTDTLFKDQVNDLVKLVQK
ncbi:MAG: chromosomal replication initiator protein DnaA [Saprospiraceae bacterium]